MRKPMRITLRCLLLLALTAAGCEGTPGSAGPDLGGGGNNDGPGGSDGPRFDTPSGTVAAIELRTPYGVLAELNASFYAEEQPGFHREVQRIGACRLLSFKPAQCDTFCMGVCVERNVCKPYPARLSAGALSFSGMKVQVTLHPKYQNYYYAEPPVLEDLFNAGDPVGVSAAGGEFGAFSLSAPGVATLETSSVQNHEIRLEDGSDYTFSWTPSGDPRARLRLTLNANNRGHGAPYEGILECDAPDTGSLTIAKELIVPFPDTYRWEICAGRDCPLSSALRYTQKEGQAGSRKVALTVGSRRAFWVLHRPPK
jgi:hypothetical protein